MNGACACWASFAGRDCKLPVACQESCHEVCETHGQEESCNACIGVCESSKASGALGAHNAFEDLQSTL